MTRLFVLLLMAGVCLPAQAPPPAPEVERLDSLIEELTSLKSQVSQTETRIDSLLRALSEQRGALKTKPTYNALKVTPEDNGPAGRNGPADVRRGAPVGGAPSLFGLAGVS